MDHLDSMRAFAAVADLGSFAEAARRLRLSPAAVTRAVAALEQRLGLRLLHRTTRSVRMTERGAIYRQSVQRILTDITDAERQARGEDAAPHGTLSVAAPIMFGRLHVLPIVAGLLRAHPTLSVRLTLSDRLVHLAEDGIDVAVRIGALADSALRAIKLGEVRHVLVGSPDYLRRRGKPASAADLHRHDLIAFEGTDLTQDWHFTNATPSIVRVAPRLLVTTADAAIAAAEAGLGITRTLSYQVRAALDAKRLRLVLDAFAPPALPINLVYPGTRLHTANVSVFIQAARTYFRAAFASGETL